MEIRTTEYGSYEAVSYFEIDLNELNADIDNTFRNENVRSIEEKDIEDVINYKDNALLATELKFRDNENDGMLLYDYISNYIYDVQAYSSYGYDLTNQYVSEREYEIV